MIKGFDVFREYFSDFNEQYVIIGGAACDIVFEDSDSSFRATKDIDMVLIVEALTPEFGRRFWDFIIAGGYENRAKSNGAPQFYRFDKPKTFGFPFMIELFARSELVFDSDKYDCRPLYLGEEISSLSAILLNGDYYQLLLAGRDTVTDVSILPNTYLVLFKAKAWLDLSARKAKGQSIPERDVRKHKNDVARLAALLTGNESVNVPQSVYDDITNFIEAFEKAPPDMKSLNISGVSSSDIAEILRKIYRFAPMPF
jgi:hypothetical protein